jgi:hypothetical protein
MSSSADTSAPAEHSDDRDDQGGQVSETAAMTPEGGADGTPGTDDGVPPAADGGAEQGAPPRHDYGD